MLCRRSPAKKCRVDAAAPAAEAHRAGSCGEAGGGLFARGGSTLHAQAQFLQRLVRKPRLASASLTSVTVVTCWICLLHAAAQMAEDAYSGKRAMLALRVSS